MITSDYIKKLFKGFTDRDRLLKEIKRYAIRPVMFYRPNLYTHSLHLGWILDDLSPTVTGVFGDKVDTTKMVIMGLIHDDLEIIMGDIQSAHKVRMNAQQKADLLETERDAIATIAKQFPKTIGGYNYQDLLDEGQKKKTIEAQILKYADWIDALCESLHEIYGGNVDFSQTTTDEFGSHPTPVDFYVPRLSKYAELFPDTAPLFETSHPLFTLPQEISLRKTATKYQPHTIESLEKDVGYPLYDYWKKMIKKYAAAEQYTAMYTKQE